MLWDQHTCLEVSISADVQELARYTRPGGALLSVNVGYSSHSLTDTLRTAAHFTAQISGIPGLERAVRLEDVDRIVAGGHLAIVFDLEDAGPLDGNLENLTLLHDAGVRTLAPTYNFANKAGHGCLDPVDMGLTAWGRDLVSELNEIGIVPDGSHGSIRTGLDLCEVSSRPVVYSHSCMRAVWDHPRNITDEQARACADTGGVVGITGVGIFLGPNTPTLEAMIAHIEYAVELVGIEHVGVSSDYSFDHADFLIEIQNTPERFDESYTRWGPIEWMPPERFLGLADALQNRGWQRDDITAVLGGNFRRVADASWA